MSGEFREKVVIRVDGNIFYVLRWGNFGKKLLFEWMGVCFTFRINVRVCLMLKVGRILWYSCYLSRWEYV